MKILIDEATVKLAIEALEIAQDNLRDHGDNCFLHDEGEYNRCFCGKDSLSNHLQSCVEELEQAIEQAQKKPCIKGGQCKHGSWCSEVYCQDHCEFVEQAQKQEPVAWMHNHIKGNVIAHRPVTLDRHPEHWTALYPEPKPCTTCEALARTVMLDQTSHDTSPPQRQPLSDEEISALRREVAALSANALDDYKMIQSLMAERQPLTDEQIRELTGNAGTLMQEYAIKVARAIEAAHGIKGEA